MNPSLAALAERVARLGSGQGAGDGGDGRGGQRRIVGITGAPGAGKSTVAAAVAEAVGGVVVPMDGFHLADDELRLLGRLDRKGAPDTFDPAGYLALLERLRAESGAVRAPAFDRTRECVIPDAITVPAGAVVVTEGNYLLLDSPLWRGVRPLLDAAWFVTVDDAARVDRLVARHVSYGWDSSVARERATRGSDGDNARLVAATAGRADLVIRL